jgi:hypothetical protein
MTLGLKNTVGPCAGCTITIVQHTAGKGQYAFWPQKQNGGIFHIFY